MLSLLQLSSSVIQITQFWSGFVLADLKIALNFFIILLYDLYRFKAENKERPERNKALTIENIQTQSKNENFLKAFFLKVRIILQ